MTLLRELRKDLSMAADMLEAHRAGETSDDARGGALLEAIMLLTHIPPDWTP